MSDATAASVAPPAPHDADGGGWVSSRTGAAGFRTTVRARSHAIVADEPRAVGGGDEGPTPYELLLGAVSGCMAMTLRMYADRNGWPLEHVEVRLRTARSHEPDCEHCAADDVAVTRLDRQVDLVGPLTDEQRRRLLRVADRCPVKQALERGLRIETVPDDAP